MPGRKRSTKARRQNRKFATVDTVKRLIGNRTEDKYVRVKTGTAGTAVPDVPLEVHLSPLSQGDTSVTRDGDEVYLKSLSFRYHLRTDNAALNNDANTDLSCVVRVMLVQWKEQSTPTASDILQDASARS